MSIDFVIITDNDYPTNLPKNITIIKSTLAEVRKLASEKLAIEVKIEFPYKLCDFKPAYGLIFSDLIIGYDFWGHGDIDVIFGSIRNFITNEVLNQYDLICVRHDFLTGVYSN